MAVASLPPGFRFHPTDIELIMYYLKRKVMGKKLHVEAISELNIYLFSPEDLPDKSSLKSKDLKWYFFCPREKKYASGTRMNRATETGFWKTTGKDRPISHNDRVVGMVKTLIFHEGNAPHGNRTDWVLHEYRLEDKSLADSGVVQDTFVLCKVFKKNGLGPKNGAQYGAPFKEEEWDNDVNVDISLTLPADAMSPLMNTLPENQNFFLANGVAPASSGKGCIPLMVETAQAQVQFPANKWHGDCQNNVRVSDVVDPVNAFGSSLTDVDPVKAFGSSLADVDPVKAFDSSLADVGPIHFVDEAGVIIARLMSELFNDDALPSNDISNIQNLGSCNTDPASQLTGSDPFNVSGREIDAPASQLSFDQSNFLLQNGVPFIESADFDAPFVSFIEFRGPEQSMFTGMLNSDNGLNHGIEQPFGYGSLFGSNRSNPILNEHAALPNSVNGLFDPLVSPLTMIGFGNNFSEGDCSGEPFYHESNSRPWNIEGEGEIKESDNSKFF